MTATATIVVPCYNDGAYIRDAVTSAQRQTYAATEIVIVDDGSEDEATRETLRQMEKEGLRVVWNDHRGVAHARNTGIRCATGTYILPLDSDDRIEPEYLAEAIAVMERDASVGIVYCEADFFGEQTGKWGLPEFQTAFMLTQNIIFNAAVFRKSDWEAVGGYDETMRIALEDWDFWLSLLEKGLRPVRIPKTLFHCRKRPYGESHSRRSLSPEDKRQVLHYLAAKHRALYAEHLEEYLEFVRWLMEQQAEERAPQIRLDVDNRWVKISSQFDWAAVEAQCGETFEFLHEWTEKTARLALGAVMIQEISGVSDEELMESLAENPYMRYFCGLSFSGRERAIPVETYRKIKQAMTQTLLQEILQTCMKDRGAESS